MKKLSLLLILFCFACSKPTPNQPNLMQVKSALNARVFIVEPTVGQEVTSPVKVKFGVEGAELASAGTVKENSGHHHLLVDVETLPPLDQPLPFTDHILHFGQAQTETSVNLTPGPHTLQLVFAAGNHIPHNPPLVSEKVQIMVK